MDVLGLNGGTAGLGRHPDKNQSEEAKAMFQSIHSAYTRLTDPHAEDSDDDYDDDDFMDDDDEQDAYEFFKFMCARLVLPSSG